jgi:hypothetical protein
MLPLRETQGGNEMAFQTSTQFIHALKEKFPGQILSTREPVSRKVYVEIQR